MRFINDIVPPYDLTYTDVFMVPSLSEVPSRLDVDLTTPDGLGTTIPVVVANMTAVAGRRMAETVARRGGLDRAAPGHPARRDPRQSSATQKSRHPVYETPITLGPTRPSATRSGLIHKRAHGVRSSWSTSTSRPIGIFTERDAAGFDRFTQLRNVMTPRPRARRPGRAGLEDVFDGSLERASVSARPWSTATGGWSG